MLRVPVGQRLSSTNPNTKLLYDKGLSEWTSRYQKNKRELDRVHHQCDQLRHEAQKLQDELDRSSDRLRHLEDRFQNEVAVRLSTAKQAYEVALGQKHMISTQIAENRKLKRQLETEKKSMTSDYDRKYAELTRTLEQRGKLDEQLEKLANQLEDITEERRRGERELDILKHQLRENTGVVDQLNAEMQSVREGIKHSVEQNMLSVDKSKFK